MVAQFTVSAHLVRMRVQAAATLGVDPQSVYRLATLDERRFDDPDARLSLDEELAIWRAIVALTGDEHIGLKLGRSFRLAALGLLGYVLMNAGSLGQCIRKYCRYELFIADTYRHTFEVDADFARYAMDALGPWHAERKHTLDLSMVGTMTACEEHVARTIPVRQAYFRFAEPANVVAYERAFPEAELRFGCERTEVAFDRDAAELPLIGANRALFDTFETQVRERLARLNRIASYASRVRQLIAEHMDGEVTSIGEVAEALATSPRNLQLKLKREGTSFQQLLDECRRETATLFLENGLASPAEIAYLLGFSEVGSFSRSFRRWTGETPTAYRRAVRS